jgi:cytochrome o ubiquinol oxidase operon protein cyoD
MMESHNTKPTARREHGTTASYIVGFILSLIFTVIPYYLVVNKSVSGNALVATILGFGVIQMLIQIFFFLHLGRGPKPLYNVVFFFATAGVIIIVIGASLLIMNNLYRNMSPGEVTIKVSQKENISQVSGTETGACNEIKNSHVVTFEEGRVEPAFIEASRCDSLTFINQDDKIRDIAFGPHPEHDSYAGESDIVLNQGDSETITLNQSGNYLFHDHLETAVSGFLIVKE